MLEPLSVALTQLVVGPPRSSGGLTVFPLSGPSRGPEALGLKAALADNLLEITELPDGARVPTLRVQSRCEHPILALDGEELLGARQDRILNTAVLIPPGFEGELPVSCVEKGRWRHTSERFRSSGRSMPSSMRRRSSSSVERSLRRGADFRADQGEVWREVDALHRSMGTRSPTSAMGDSLGAIQAELDAAQRELVAQAGEVGTMVFCGDELLATELVGNAGSWGAVSPTVLSGFIMEALVRRRTRGGAAEAQDAGPSVEAARRLLARLLLELREAEARRHDSPGAGHDLRFEVPSQHGSVLVQGDDLVHAVVWPR